MRVSDGTPAGQSARKEKTSILVPCQIETRSPFDALTMTGTGDSPNSVLTLVFHFSDLERLGLVDAATGLPTIRNGDRLVAIRKHPGGELVQAVRTPPGLYATEPQTAGFGLSGGQRNLLVVRFEDRDQSAGRTAQ